jgi:hypothetical protein
VRDVDEDQGQVFIVMDYFACGDLRRWIADHGPLSRPEILRVLGEVASALDYIHARKLVHRDVKPGNILMDADGGAHLCDFGLVRPPGAPHLTQIGSVVGSATYLSPEQAMSRPEIDGRADQYALGVIAYELLVGRSPFEAQTSTQMTMLHVTEAPPAPSALNAAIPIEVDEALLRALAKQPAERFASCGEFVRSLGAAYAASALRRFHEQRDAAQADLGQAQYAGMRQALGEARALLLDYPELLARADVQSELAQLEKDLELAETYEQGVKDWQRATLKAKEVLALFPNFPDPQQVFAALGVRTPPRRLPPPAEIARQTMLGILLAAPGIAAALWLAFLWITRP